MRVKRVILQMFGNVLNFVLFLQEIVKKRERKNKPKLSFQ